MQDVDAIRACRQGNADAFRHLVHRYQRRALAHARTLTGNDADAADAAQDAFLDAFRHLNGFDAAREFYPWFYVLLPKAIAVLVMAASWRWIACRCPIASSSCSSTWTAGRTTSSPSGSTSREERS